MKRLTGTHVYSYLECPHRVALDLHRDRSERRAPHPWEEFSLARGRTFEKEFVAGLVVAEPQYPARDFEAGAAATLALMQQGAELIYQGVLLHGDRLGLLDLMRKLPGESRLGQHHYEVLDIKSSGRARGDQILQVVFYARLLTEVQGRAPEHGGLILKDGREERFAIADYADAALEVESALRALAADAATATTTATRPFFHVGCQRCHWDHVCVPSMQQSHDLSLVQGMSQGARAILEAAGCRTVADLAAFASDGARARGNLDGALLRQLRKAAQATVAGQPVLQTRPKGKPLRSPAIVHLLTDPFRDRALGFGLLHPARAGGTIGLAMPATRDDEWRAFRKLLADLPDDAHLLHFGDALPRWYDAHAHDREAEIGMSVRFVDLARRLRGAALYPAPVQSLADFVQHGLGRDGHRAGHASAAAMWGSEPDGEQRLAAKLRSDLQDLADLHARYLETAPAATPAREMEAPW